MAENTRDPLVDYVVKEFIRYEAAWRDDFTIAEKVYDNWMNKAPNRKQSWQNAVHVPLTVEGEQTITPRLFTALFPTDAPVDVHVEGDAPAEQGIRIKGIIQHYFRVANVQGQARAMLTQATLYGTGYCEGGSWFVRKGYQVDKEGDRYYTQIEARPECSYVNFFEIFPHPAKLYIEDGLPLIRRRWVDKEYLKNLNENPNFKFDNLGEALNSGTMWPAKKDKEGPSYQRKQGEDYELLEYWGPWDEEYKNEQGKLATRKAVPYWIAVINRKVKVRGIPNPYNHQLPPFCRVKLFEGARPSWFGIGIGRIGLSSQERVNKIVNQRLDNVDLVLNKQGCYNGNDTLINTRRLRLSEPGKWHKVSDTVTSMRWMDTPDVTASSYEEEKLAKQDFREATGASPQLMPTEDKAQHRTAMGIQMLQGAAGMRFRPVLRQLEIDFIQALAMFFFSNLKQFMSESEWVQVTGKSGKLEPILITPEQIQAKVYFIPTGVSETMDKEIQVGQLLRFKEITANDPTVNRQVINKRIAELFGFKDINELLTPMQAPGGPPGQGGLPPDQQQKIMQRIGEGATPEQIKEELLGPRPEASPQAPQQASPGATPQGVQGVIR